MGVKKDSLPLYSITFWKSVNCSTDGQAAEFSLLKLNRDLALWWISFLCLNCHPLVSYHFFLWFPPLLLNLRARTLMLIPHVLFNLDHFSILVNLLSEVCEQFENQQVGTTYNCVLVKFCCFLTTEFLCLAFMKLVTNYWQLKLNFNIEWNIWIEWTFNSIGIGTKYSENIWIWTFGKDSDSYCCNLFGFKFKQSNWIWLVQFYSGLKSVIQFLFKWV